MDPWAVHENYDAVDLGETVNCKRVVLITRVWSPSIRWGQVIAPVELTVTGDWRFHPSSNRLNLFVRYLNMSAGI